ncbi:MAG: hypothetical protein ACJ780_21810 [Solirubrobacteraceae bacterium]
MTAWQELSARLMSSGDGGEPDSPDPGETQSPTRGETQAPERTDPWEKAPVPAQVGRKLANLAGIDPDPRRIPLLTNIMHWSYGTGWGAVYGVLAKRRLNGALFGAGVWAMSYVQLVPLGLYEPPWKYPPQQLALDFSYHLVYGVGTQSGHTLLARASS